MSIQLFFKNIYFAQRGDRIIFFLQRCKFLLILLHFLCLPFRATSQIGASFDESIVYTICEDNIGNLWIGTYGLGIYIYDGKKLINISEEEGMNSDLVYSILEDRSGDLWIGTSGAGVSRLQLDKQSLKQSSFKFTHFTKKISLISNEIYTIIQDKNGLLWLGTNDAGATLFDPKLVGRTDQDINPFMHITEGRGLNHYSVQAIREDKNGKLWLGTRGGGISRLDPEQNLADKNVPLKFTYFTTENGLSHNEISAIIEDNSGNLWFCTGGGGITMLPADQINDTLPEFVYLTTQKTCPEGRNCIKKLSNKKIFSILQDSKGNFWIGTDGSGISRLKPDLLTLKQGKLDGSKFTHFTTEDGLSHNIITSIFEDRSGIIWIGTEGGGINRFDGKNFTHFTEKWVKTERKRKEEEAKRIKKEAEARVKANEDSLINVSKAEKLAEEKRLKEEAEAKAKAEAEKLKKEAERKKLLAEYKENLDFADMARMEERPDWADASLVYKETKAEAVWLKKEVEREKKILKNITTITEADKELLVFVAESENFERKSKGGSFDLEYETLQQQVESKENVLSGESQISKKAKEEEKRAILNQQAIKEHLKIIIIEMAETERAEKIASLKLQAGKNIPKDQFTPKIIEKSEQGTFKTIKYIIIQYPAKQIVFQQISYIWGVVSYYKNEKEIDEKIYLSEIEKYKDK
ncbi:MAG: hypothetical protein FVQ77_03275 [Cytophagales bacterium]|nr:hypothetical protein [Cytophagales bacterium]